MCPHPYGRRPPPARPPQVEVFERSGTELESKGSGLVLQPDLRDFVTYYGIPLVGSLHYITLHYNNLKSTEPRGLMGRLGSVSLMGLGTEHCDITVQ